MNYFDSNKTNTVILKFERNFKNGKIELRDG